MKKKKKKSIKGYSAEALAKFEGNVLRAFMNKNFKNVDSYQIIIIIRIILQII